MNTQSKRPVYFFGTQGVFSTTVCRALLEYPIPIEKIVLAGKKPADKPARSIPVMQNDQSLTTSTLAESYQIPIQYITNAQQLDASFLREKLWRESCKPAYVLVACFPFILSASLLENNSFTFLNIHPSLLPRYRGPDPIFWQLNHKETDTGVSVHLMTSHIDAGPICAQQRVPLPRNASYEHSETLLATAGAKLFIELIQSDVDIQKTAQIQDESEASYYRKPTIKEYQLLAQKHVKNETGSSGMQ